MKTTGNGRKGCSFVNGYSLHLEPVKNGAKHNVYFIVAFLDRKFDNYFTIPTCKLKIKYNKPRLCVVKDSILATGLTKVYHHGFDN